MSWPEAGYVICAYDYPCRRCREPCGNAGMQMLGTVMDCEEEELCPSRIRRVRKIFACSAHTVKRSLVPTRFVSDLTSPFTEHSIPCQITRPCFARMYSPPNHAIVSVLRPSALFLSETAILIMAHRKNPPICIMFSH